MNLSVAQEKNSTVAWLAAWVLLSAAGMSLGIVATLQLLWSVSTAVEQSIGALPAQVIGGAIFGLGLGGVTGVLQYITLRAAYVGAARWVPASILGAVLACIIAFPLSAQANPGGDNILMTALAFAIMGLVTGAVQFAMVRSIVRHPVWIAATGLGLGIGAALVFGVGKLPLVDNEFISLAIGGMIYGLCTASVFWWNDRN